jgi:DNA primase
VFKKAETLYGFNLAKKDIREKNYALLVEGQFDLVLSHQAGFHNAVASSGTALGDKGLDALGRLSKNILLVFDADRAGIVASGRVAKLALPRGFNVKAALLPKGSDPADTLHRNPNLFRDALKGAVHIIDFYFGLLDKAGYEERKFSLEVSRVVLPYIVLVENKMEQAYFVRKVAEKTGAPESSVWAEISKIEKAPALSRLVEGATAKTENNLPQLLSQIRLYADKKGLSDIASLIKRRYEEITEQELPIVSIQRESEILFEMELMFEYSEIESLAQEILLRLERESLQKELARITELLKLSENAGNEEESAGHMAEFQSIAGKLELLK